MDTRYLEAALSVGVIPLLFVVPWFLSTML